MNPIFQKFKDDVKNNDGASPPPPASTIVWLDNQNTENETLIADKKQGERRIGLAQDDEIKMWLENHVEHLQSALQEICDQEHAYHYSPPGYHVDETAMELEAF